MEIKAYKCDACGRERQQANHWFVARIGEAFHIYHWEFFYGECDGEGSKDTSIDIKHICGQECLGKMLQPFLDKRSQPQESTIQGQ